MIFHENYAKNRTLTTFLWIFEKMFASSLRTQPDNHRFIFLCFRFFLFSMKPLDWVHFQLWIQLVSRQTLLWFNWVHLLYLTSCTVSFEMCVCVCGKTKEFQTNTSFFPWWNILIRCKAKWIKSTQKFSKQNVELDSTRTCTFFFLVFVDSEDLRIKRFERNKTNGMAGKTMWAMLRDCYLDECTEEMCGV